MGNKITLDKIRESIELEIKIVSKEQSLQLRSRDFRAAAESDTVLDTLLFIRYEVLTGNVWS